MDDGCCFRSQRQYRVAIGQINLAGGMQGKDNNGMSMWRFSVFGGLI
jgi:hypothetical protein